MEDSTITTSNFRTYRQQLSILRRLRRIISGSDNRRNPTEGIPSFIPVGDQVANPSHLLSNGRLRRLSDRLTPVLDRIIADSPPRLVKAAKMFSPIPAIEPSWLPGRFNSGCNSSKGLSGVAKAERRWSRVK
jgi:hypothetical protein